MSIPLLMSMVTTVAATAQPAPLPAGTTIGGRYFCNADITGGNSKSEVNLVYNANTGSLTGLLSRTARHSFGYNMTNIQMERTRKGIFYWGADMRNKNHYPVLSNILFLLSNGDLASARVSRIPDGTDYVVTREDMKSIVIFSKTGDFPDIALVAREIGSLASSIWGGRIFEDNVPATATGNRG